MVKQMLERKLGLGRLSPSEGTLTIDKMLMGGKCKGKQSGLSYFKIDFKKKKSVGLLRDVKMFFLPLTNLQRAFYQQKVSLNILGQILLGCRVHCFSGKNCRW